MPAPVLPRTDIQDPRHGTPAQPDSRDPRLGVTAQPESRDPRLGATVQSVPQQARVSPFDVAPVQVAKTKSPFDVPSSSSSHGPRTSHTSVVPSAVEEPTVHSDRARYFVITSNTKDNVVKSVRHGVWATQRKNETKLDEAYRTSSAVILVFSVNRSDAFQGYALMRSPIGRPNRQHVDPFNGFGRLFEVEWLRLHDLQYREVELLRNPLNADQPVRFSRDGQELTNTVGRRLCGIIDRHIDDPESFPAPPQPQSSPHPQLAVPPPPPFVPLHAQLPPGAMMPSGKRDRAQSSASSEGSGRRKKKRRRERKYRNAPHPVTDSFDDHLAFFIGLDYEDYLSWWKRHGAVSPGPTLPAGPAPPLASFAPAVAAPAAPPVAAALPRPLGPPPLALGV